MHAIIVSYTVYRYIPGCILCIDHARGMPTPAWCTPRILFCCKIACIILWHQDAISLITKYIYIYIYTYIYVRS